MCLGIPGRVIELWEEDGVKFGTVDYGNLKAKVCFELLPNVQVGDYVIVHVGFALSRLDEQEAIRTLELLEGVASSHEIYR